MPKGRHRYGKLNIIDAKRNVIHCRFCKKALTKKEIELHLLVCEKVPQEIFDETHPHKHLFHDAFGR